MARGRIDRRQFVRQSVGATAALTLPWKRRTVSASEKVTVGVMGLGGRGTTLADRLARRDDVAIALLCDVDQGRFERALDVVDAAGGGTPEVVSDFRRMLERDDLDAVVVATPVHWHALATILACQAGKDVYVEKPASHSAWEGAKMVEAARKYGQVVQVGIQNRSAPYVHEALELVRSGLLGQIHFVRVLNMIQDGFQQPGPESPVPARLDWDLWCGPAPLAPYRPGRWWNNRWDYSAGTNTDDLVHQIDLARAAIDAPFPDTVCHAGGVQVIGDGREIPDTQLVTYEFGEVTLFAQATLWARSIRKTPHSVRDGDQLPDWESNGTKVELFGTEGRMTLGRHGGGYVAHDNDGKQVAAGFGRQVTDEHLGNWVDCIRTRAKPHGDIAEGHRSTLLCHLANVSYRAGNRKLVWDGALQDFHGSDPASRWLRRAYRAPWVVPDEV